MKIEERDETSHLLTPDEREEKLPKWAQDTLHRLRMRLDEAKRQARRANYAGETDTVFEPYSDIPGKVRPGTTVAFILGQTEFGQDQYILAKVRRWDGESVVELHGSATLTVQGNSSNVLLASVKDR